MLDSDRAESAAATVAPAATSVPTEAAIISPRQKNHT